jgi:two-component system, NtrC family, response regulator AtoC
VTRVLIIDDEEGMRYSLSVILSKTGLETVAVENGARALKILAEDDAFDFILCDLRMPEMDGLTFLEKYPETGCEALVIMMSAYGTIDLAVEAMKKGAFDYVSKPFKPEEILVVMQKATERKELETTTARLQNEVEDRFSFQQILTRNDKMIEILENVRKIADYKTTVLINGESGTGKELVARAIHYTSKRAKMPFVAINCGAIPENLLESELFGHLRGAFTDARSNKEGLIPSSSGGTLFLDEIGELPLHLQVKLLRVLQEEEVRPVGGNDNIAVDLRVVAATINDLEKQVRKGLFREDLYYRLNIFPIQIPSLRDRHEDIPLLVDHFIERSQERLGKKIGGMQAKALKLLAEYSWPGNVRELENVIERAVVLCEENKISPDNIPDKIRDFQLAAAELGSDADLSIKRHSRLLEERMIRAALERTGGNRTRASKLLEISHRALLYKIQEYDIKG